MADNKTQIVITAEDRASAVFGKVQQSMGALAGAVPALAGALSVGAIASWVKGNIDAADTMNDLSQKVGINIKDLATWKLAAEQSGTSIESVAKGVKGLSGYMVDHSAKLRAAGITATDANGAMIQLADLFQAMPDGVEKTALAVQLFGKAGMDMIPMLNGGSKGLAESQAKAAAYAKELEKLAPDADKFNDTLRELKLQSEVTGLAFAGKLIGPMQTMAEALKEARSGADGLYNALKKLQDLTQSGPLSIFGLAAMGADMARPRSKGYSGPKNAQGLPMSDEEQFSAATDAYMADTPARAAAADARKRAQALLDKGGAAAGGGTDTALQRMLALGQKNLGGSIDSEEEQRILGEKRAMQDARTEFEALQRMLKRGEENELAAYYETAGEETMRLVTAQQELNRAGKDAFDGLGQAIESWGNKAADTFAEFVVTGKASFGDLVNSMLMDIARLQAKKMLDPIIKGAGDWLSGALGGLFGGGGGGGDMASARSFAGGGYTGGGSRSGGLDGQGGFMAMLHPQESVIDHARSGGGGTAPNIVVNVINPPGSPATARQQGAPSFDGSNWVISVVMEAAGSNPGFRAAMGLGR